MNEKDFGKGGCQDKHDSRDKQWCDIAAAKSSTPFDWMVGFDIEKVLQLTLNDPAFKLPVKNQDGSFSCGGQAWATYQSVIEALATKTFEERSAKYIYAQTHVPGGGSYGRDNCNIAVRQGVSKEVLLPSYENGLPPSETFMTRSTDITQPIRDEAATDRDLVYAAVDVTNIDSLAQAIRDNGGAIIGIRGSNNGTWLSPFPQPPKPGEELWGHWIYVGKAAMVNGKKYVRILNSWGLSAGEAGWQWIGEDYFASGNIFNIWTEVYFNQELPNHLQHQFNTNLFYGCQSFGGIYPDEIKALQTALLIDGEFPTDAYKPENLGYFGGITFNAVIAFQRKYGIAPVSGYVGNITRGKLNQLFS